MQRGLMAGGAGGLPGLREAGIEEDPLAERAARGSSATRFEGEGGGVRSRRSDASRRRSRSLHSSALAAAARRERGRERDTQPHTQ
jgi:hypothetical protein